MDLRDFRYFEAVADFGHLGRAAEAMHRTQPALSKSLRRLEEALGATLFEREGRRLKLTEVGRVVLERTRFMRRTMDDTLQEVTDLARGAAGHLRLGGAPTAADRLLPQLVHALLERAPGLTLHLAVDVSASLLQALRAGTLDAVVGPLASAKREFERHVLFDDPVVVAASKRHPLLRRTAPAPQIGDLAGYAWVLPSPDVSLRVWLENTFERNGLAPPRVQVESASISLMPRLIAHNQLLTLISRKSLQAGPVGTLLREVPVPSAVLERQFGVLLRRDGYRPPPVRTLLAVLKEGGQRLLT
ncbi:MULTISPECIES: LysR family transcriptional regulator [Ramlibacter]|nr:MULTISPECIES: LysR family transcriptional regulator [Ramlibacter]MBA2962383.1 LysR family transcriptional regulator [Ramlibacter sp. CGMCC 1.13660]